MKQEYLKKERILVNLNQTEIEALDGLANTSRRSRSGVLALLIEMAGQDIRIKAGLGGAR